MDKVLKKYFTFSKLFNLPMSQTFNTKHRKK